MARFVGVAAALAAVLAVIATTGAHGASDLHATPSTFASAVSSAQAGDTILLATGNYGTWSGTNKAITIKNEPGATPSMKFSFDTGVGGFTLDGMTGMSGDISNGAHDITIKNSAFNDTTKIQGVSQGNILLDHDTFNNIGCDSGCLPRIWLPGETPHHSGVTVQNSQFIGGSSDGVQAGTALNIVNNEFANIVHGGCGSCHTDNIQLYSGQAQDGVGSTIKGNYIHDGETGIVQFDGGGGNDVEDNVIARMSLFGMDFGGDNGSKIIHNTEFQMSGQGLDMTSKAGQNSVNAVIKDNVLKSIALDDSDSTARPSVNTNNMLLSEGSSPNFNGTPVFAGGSNPTTYAGFALASGSPGKGRASDGLDVGARFGGGSSTPPPPDTTPPDTTIGSGPGDPTTSTSASFAFTSSESGSTFQCKLDAGSYAACASPKSYSGLATGQHTFSVRATDAAGNTDASPATRTWTISTANDTTPPDTTITAGPGGPTNDTTPTFAFTASESGSTFACRVDGGAYATCTSPWTTAALADGSHTVSVRATDQAGNTDATPATRGFTVDTVAPRTTITSAPSDNSDSTDASVTFAVNEAGSTSECRLDSGPWSPCTSPFQVSGLAAGSHSIGVRSTDPAGNVESPGASASWTVGSGGGPGEPPPADAPPTVQLTAPAVGSVVSGRFRIVASADDDHGLDHVELWVGGWRVDRDYDEPYATRLDARRLSPGIHTLSARAFDSAGQSASAALTAFVSSSEGSRDWAQVSSTAADGVTRLTGQSIAGSDVRVSLTWCSSGRGYVADSFTLHADKDGHLDATYAGGNRCVLRLDPMTG